MTEETGAIELERTRGREHPTCWVCSPDNPKGLDVRFRGEGADCVCGRFACPDDYMGYTGYLHGGVVSSLLDGAMTNCLLARGEVAVTAQLQVRFRRPVLIGQPVDVRAWVDHSRRGVHVVRAELKQGDASCATAEGRFMDHPREYERSPA